MDILRLLALSTISTNSTTASSSFTEQLARAYHTYSSPQPQSSSSRPAAMDSIFSNALYYAYYVSTLLASYTPHLYSLIRATTTFVQTVDAMTILCGLVALFLLFRIVDYIRKMIMFWVRLAIRIVLVIVLIQVVVYYWHVGLGELGMDAGKAWGFISEAFEPNEPSQGWRPEPGGARGWGASGKRAGGAGRGRRQGRRT